MIRYFPAFFKPNHKKYTDIELFTRAVEMFNPQESRCPVCGAIGNFSFLCFYERDMVTYDRGVSVHNLSVARHICQSCDSSHAVLPEILIPFGSYSLLFVIAVLREYFSREFSGCTVREILNKYQISASTLYAWKKRFLIHKALWLGALANLAVSAQGFLENSVPCSELARGFFSRFRFSFLQNHHASVSAVP